MSELLCLMVLLVLLRVFDMCLIYEKTFCCWENLMKMAINFMGKMVN